MLSIDLPIYVLIFFRSFSKNHWPARCLATGVFKENSSGEMGGVNMIEHSFNMTVNTDVKRHMYSNCVVNFHYIYTHSKKKA